MFSYGTHIYPVFSSYRATEEIEKTQKSAASEIAKLEAALRKAEVQVQSMESSLEQKVLLWFVALLC